MNNPLVSVIVITYNSFATVVETLDSIKNQKYQNIELIISDDCSKDETVDVCKKWLETNHQRFVSTNLITVEKNTGTSANCNRGWRISKGYWIKLIAGDDRLLPNCISDYINYIRHNPNAKIIFSRVAPFGNIVRIKTWSWFDGTYLFEHLTQRQIRILLCYRNPLPAASVIIFRDTLQTLGGYNESVPLIEDWPLWMKATNEAGISLHFLNKQTTEYRFSGESLSHGKRNKQFDEDINKCLSIGSEYLKKQSVFSRFYIYSVLHAGDNIFMKCLHLINVLNPFYYEYNYLIKMYEKTMTKLAIKDEDKAIK